MASYAIISVGGKQYRVREGERLLVDRVATEEGQTFSPTVLLVGGDGDPQLAPKGAAVTARVVAQERGPKIRIGKYRKRTGYRRHTGFRAALTRIEIEAIGGGKAASASTKAEKERPARDEKAPAAVGSVPDGYADMTVADVKGAAGSWSTAELHAALEYEQAHAGRKGAVAAASGLDVDVRAIVEHSCPRLVTPRPGGTRRYSAGAATEIVRRSPERLNSTMPSRTAKIVSSRPRPVPGPGLNFVPRCRTMIMPAFTGWPANTLTPSRLDSESRPLRDEPRPFLCAIYASSSFAAIADSIAASAPLRLPCACSYSSAAASIGAFQPGAASLICATVMSS